MGEFDGANEDEQDAGAVEGRGQQQEEQQEGRQQPETRSAVDVQPSRGQPAAAPRYEPAPAPAPAIQPFEYEEPQARSQAAPSCFASNATPVVCARSVHTLPDASDMRACA